MLKAQAKILNLPAKNGLWAFITVIMMMMIIFRIILAEDRLKKHKTQQPQLAEIEQSHAHRNLRLVYSVIVSFNACIKRFNEKWQCLFVQEDISCFILGLIRQLPIEEMIFHKISISLFCDPQ